MAKATSTTTKRHSCYGGHYYKCTECGMRWSDHYQLGRHMLRHQVSSHGHDLRGACRQGCSH